MNIRQWIADNVGYRFGGLFDGQGKGDLSYIEKLIPRSFLNRNISDFGCGDGTNTLFIKDLFKPKAIVGYERNEFLIKRARKKGLEVIKIDLKHSIPKGELAVFSRSFHHFQNKELLLRKVKENFDYIFLFEPMKDLFHALFDGGTPLSKANWIKLFDKVLVKYDIYRHSNDLIVFYTK